MTKEKLPVFKFKTNIPEKVNFQSDVLKEGESQYGHWKMYKIQINATDYILYPTNALQMRLDQIGNVKGRMLEIGMYESGNGKKYWQIMDENDEEIDFDYSQTKPAPKKDNHPMSDPLLKEMNTKLDQILNILNGGMAAKQATPVINLDEEANEELAMLNEERNIADELPF